MQINWIKCSEQMPPDDINYQVICRSNGKKIWDSNGHALVAASKLHDEWELKKSFLEWSEFTEEAWESLSK